MTKWPADRVERRALESLVPYARNARTHSDAQIAQIAASMREWGWTNPVLIDEAGGIIAGHGRVLAAKSLGLAEVPVMIAEGWSEAQKRAYVLADNQLALNAGWDMDLLPSELKGLQEWGFDLSLLGFTDIDELMAGKTAGRTDPDEAPEAPVNPVTRLGDVWLLGRHRVICGDSTDAATVERGPAYCDVIVKRWQEFAGGEAVLDATGQTFEQVDAARWNEAGEAHDSAASYDAAIGAMRERAAIG